MTTRIARITDLLSILNPSSLEIIDETIMHKGHAGFDGIHAETHLKIKICADFGAVTVLEKHRMINSLLKAEFDSGLHALSLDIVKAVEL